MPKKLNDAAPGDEHSRRLSTLQQLLAIEATEVKSALDEASNLISVALDADKVDVFLLDQATSTLVAEGTSHTPMGRRQHELGLDLLQVANGGRTVEVFQTGKAYSTGHADEDPGVLTGVKGALGVRSMIMVPLDVAGVRRGVLSATSAQPDRFGEEDLLFLHAVADWIALITHRAELVERIAEEAAAAGRRAAAEELISVLAHDLGNYMTPLAGHIGILLRRARKQGRADDVDDAASAARALERVRRLVDDLLDASRLEHGLLQLNAGPIDLGHLVLETAAALQTREAPIKVRVDPDVIVKADADRVRQIVENLLSNAIKHSPPGVPITLEVTRTANERGKWAVLTVQDQGPGIPAELMPQLFQRFARGPGSTGLGLGLHLAWSIAQAHGGTLEAETDRSVGAGFRLLLPYGAGEGAGDRGQGAVAGE